MSDEIRTPRLVIRRATMADVVPMHRIMNDTGSLRRAGQPVSGKSATSFATASICD